MFTELCLESENASSPLSLASPISGLIFRNPKPHVRSLHAYFPSVVVFSEKHLGASVVLGEAFEAPNCHLVYFESYDGGVNWKRKSDITSQSQDHSVSTFGRLTCLVDGRLLALVSRYDREPDDNGLTEEGEGLCMRPMSLESWYSSDHGGTWVGPFPLEMPYRNTAFEMCASCHVLPDGTMLWPTSTWPDTNLNSPHGFQTVAIGSKDQGRTWSEAIRVFHDDKHIYWESKITALPDGRLLAVAWVHDLDTGRDLPNRYAIGSPDGKFWSEPRSMDLTGQTATPVVLENGEIFNFYRRMDSPGLWVSRSRLNGDVWENLDQECLWGGNGAAANGHNIRDHFATLRFGAPSAVRLPNGGIFMAFWCVEGCVSNIRYFKFSPSAQ